MFKKLYLRELRQRPIKLESIMAGAAEMESDHYLANYTIEQEIGRGSFATVYLGHEQVRKSSLDSILINLEIWCQGRNQSHQLGKVKQKAC